MHPLTHTCNKAVIPEAQFSSARNVFTLFVLAFCKLLRRDNIVISRTRFGWLVTNLHIFSCSFLFLENLSYSTEGTLFHNRVTTRHEENNWLLELTQDNKTSTTVFTYSLIGRTVTLSLYFDHKVGPHRKCSIFPFPNGFHLKSTPWVTTQTGTQWINASHNHIYHVQHQQLVMKDRENAACHHEAFRYPSVFHQLLLTA